MKRYCRIAVVALLTVSLFPTVARAQTYPVRPVRVVVVYPPGGSNDLTGRIVFQKMSEMIGQQFVIENRGGAAGSIGADMVAKSPPDGYTIMVQSASHLANAFLYRKLPYDTLNDFIGVSMLIRQVGILMVHPSMPVKSVGELIALAKKRPDQILYGSAGSGSGGHLMMAQLISMAGVQMVHVPYRGGSPSMTATVSGEVQAIVSIIGPVLSHINANRVRALAVTSENRVKEFPELPAIGETVPGYEFTAWVGAFVPAGTPRPIVDKLNAELKKVLSDPAVTERLSKLTADPLYTTPEEFARQLKSGYAQYKKLIEMTGAKID
ncbi:MAG: tripartite tricarboxylate transporter substrate binding protein [Betaproteobacteria bacterium]|nr:tripartite tricarboxylate transporter substrate binding protein [Betaproteobacteria bacterium]